MPEAEFKKIGKNRTELILSGRIDTKNSASLWKKVLPEIKKNKPAHLTVNAENVEYLDSAGSGLLLNIRNLQKQKGCDCEIVGLDQKYRDLCNILDPGKLPETEKQRKTVKHSVEKAGRILSRILNDLAAYISFLGEVTAKLTKTLIFPKRLRIKDTVLLAENAGADAFGITALLGFLVGLILAFQSAIPLQRFGVQIFVADIVSISIFRELGPLLTAFILASRSSSAFAAEIGTMKINEEIDAMKTMGLDPMVFLVVPRIIAAVFITPLLTMVNNLFGLLGLAVVMSSLGFPTVTYINQIKEAVTMSDFIGGLAKTFVFGIFIASIGCMRGMQTKTGPRAVGQSATSAVVTSIVSIIVIDGIFAVVYYILGI